MIIISTKLSVQLRLMGVPLAERIVGHELKNWKYMTLAWLKGRRKMENDKKKGEGQVDWKLKGANVISVSL